MAAQRLDRLVLARSLGDAIGGYLPASQRLVLGWLLVCEPAEQSQADLRAALDLSLGSVSAAVTKLDEVGLLEKRTAPGSRVATYRLRDNAWVEAVERSLTFFSAAAHTVRTGAAALDGEGDARVVANVSAVIRYMEAAQSAVESLLVEIRQ